MKGLAQACRGVTPAITDSHPHLRCLHEPHDIDRPTHTDLSHFFHL